LGSTSVGSRPTLIRDTSVVLGKDLSVPSLPRSVVATYLRLVLKPRMATPEATRARINEPKADPAPPAGLIRRHRVSTDVIGGFTCYRLSPDGAGTPRAAVLYLHGGAYINEIVREHWRFVGRLVDAGCQVVVPIYGLAPRHTYREAFPLITAAYRRLLDHADPSAVTVAGDSAGGGLALAFAQTLPAVGLPQPGRLVLLAPWLDITMSNPEIIAVERLDPWLTPRGLVVAGEAWAGGDDPSLPRLSPINGDLTALPALDLYVGTHDVLYPDTRRLHDLATGAGVPSTLHAVSGAFHVYPLAPVREGRRAVTQIVRGVSGAA
jgi:epsilon-lactone hydrolase